jgi:hypothetical protein
MSPIVQIPPQSHLNFGAYPVVSMIQVQRVQWIGGAEFVVYSDGGTLGAGSCPALAAHPPYIAVRIPANTPFTVQNVSAGVTIEVTY